MTPSLNLSRYLDDLLKSVESQDLQSAEHIIVDGGSGDGSLTMIREYAKRRPGKVQWISEPDGGQCDALNKGIALADGKYIGWQNCDDYYLPGAFTQAVNYLETHDDVAGLFGDCIKTDAQGRIIGRWATGAFDYGRLLEQDYIPNQSAFIRREILQELKISLDIEFAMDYDLWLRLGKRHKLAYFPVALAVNRVVTSAKSQRGMYGLLLDRVAAVERAIMQEGAAARWPHGNRALLRHVLKALLVACLIGRPGDARLLLKKAVELRCSPGDWLWACKNTSAKSPWANDHPGDGSLLARVAGMLEQEGTLLSRRRHSSTLHSLRGDLYRTGPWHIVQAIQIIRGTATRDAAHQPDD